MISAAAAGQRLFLCALLSLGLFACTTDPVRSPFVADAGEAGAPGSDDSEGGLNVGVDAGDPTLGGPCSDDGQCDDGLSCTADACDTELQRCRHTPDDTPCSDGVYCNGAEVCDPKLGCHAGAPVSCSDGNSCTLDTCVEADQSCRHAPRDADGDGDPVWNCPGGGDCDDTDPSVSSLAQEICGNGKDDNCNGQIDEEPCIAPAYDTCSDPLVVSESPLSSSATAPISEQLSLAATAFDYPTDCVPAGPTFHDVVVAFVVPKGPAQDIDVVAQSAAELDPSLPDRQVSLATANSCGDAASVQCSPDVATPNGSLSRFHFYSAAPGNHFLYVAANQAASTASAIAATEQTEVDLTVKFAPGTSPPSNVSCDTALGLEPGSSVVASLVAVTEGHLASACYEDGAPAANPGGMPTPTSAELVYTFTLESAQDVRLFASPLDAYGVSQLSLRDAHCSKLADELTCRVGSPTSLFARSLPAGQYFVSVSATGPSDVQLQLEESSPSAAPQDQGCVASPALTLGQTVNLDLAGHVDAVNLGCLPGAPDSSHSLVLSSASDVLLLGASSNADTVGVALSLPSCTQATRLACGLSTSTALSSTQVYTSVARAHAYGVAAGTYRVVAESAAGDPVSLTALARSAQPAALVVGADDCSAPFEIPATGGHFTGNTANAHADYDAGCDIGNQAAGGAPDQMLHLKLNAKSRVVLDMAGSNYSTMLSVRTGASCPGTEVQLACAAGYVPDRSFLDLDLDSGDYYVQVDGYAGDSGAWSLDVYVLPEST